MAGGLIHVVDDDEHVRIVTGGVLDDAGYDVRLYGSGDDFFARADLSVPACVILDLRMPGMSGEDVLMRLATTSSPLKILVVSGHVDIPRAVAAMRGGAVNVLQKPWKPSELLDAVAQGFAKLPPPAPVDDVAERLRQLTPRERDVIEAVASHGTNRRAAAALGLSVRTVEWYRASAMRRLRVSSRAEMLNLYFQAHDRTGAAAGPLPDANDTAA